MLESLEILFLQNLLVRAHEKEIYDLSNFYYLKIYSYIIEKYMLSIYSRYYRESYEQRTSIQVRQD